MYVSRLEAVIKHVIHGTKDGGERVCGRDDLCTSVFGGVYGWSYDVSSRCSGLLTTLASMNAYSKSDLPSRSCCRRYEAFRTSRKRATWTAREGGR